MPELLVELLSEEIPARMQAPMAKTLKTAVESRLKKDELPFSAVSTYVTPRRLTLHVDGRWLTTKSTAFDE